MDVKRQVRQNTKMTKSAIKKDKKKILPDQTVAATQLSVISPTGIFKLIGYALAVIPPFGFLIAMIYFPQHDEAAKRFGRNCIVLAAIGLVGVSFYWAMGLLVKGVDVDFLGGYY